MQEYVGVFRTGERLEHAYKEIRKIRVDFEKVYIDDKSDAFNTDLLTTFELRNLIDLAEGTVQAALAREESRGAHTRDEFPDRNDKEWMKHTLVYWNHNRQGTDLDYEEVRQTGNPRYEPVERKY